MVVSRRTFSAALVAGAAASLASTRGMAATATPTKARKHRPPARTLRRRIMLVRGDRTIAGGRAQCHGRAKPSDDAA